ncbi:EcWRKY-72, partial [Eragrostis curvula]
MASRLKRKHPNSQGAVMRFALEAYSCLPGGMFSLYPSESSASGARKKRKNKLSWVDHSYAPYFDGHLWRKYGQKIIKDATYPRCSYNQDRRCMASKQVQQMDNHDPPLYEVTYMYEHTCNAKPVPAPDVVAAAAAAAAPTAIDGLVLNFGSSGSGHQQCAAKKQKQLQQYHQWQSVPPGQSSMMNIDSWKGQLHEKPASSWSPPYSTNESSPSTSNNSEDSLFWSLDMESLGGLIGQLDDLAQFPGKTGETKDKEQ